jgi:hypothetical protein
MPVDPAKDVYVLDTIEEAVTYDVTRTDDMRRIAEGVLDALLTMPTNERTALAERLLLEPPVDKVKDKLPLILYFNTREDILEFIAAAKEALPGLTAYRT